MIGLNNLADELHKPITREVLKRTVKDLKHRQRNVRRRRFVTEADWTKGFVFGRENAVQLPRQMKAFSLLSSLSCYSLVMAFKDLRNLHLISYDDGLIDGGRFVVLIVTFTSG